MFISLFTAVQSARAVSLDSLNDVPASSNLPSTVLAVVCNGMIRNIIIIVTSNDAAHKKNIGVKVLNSAKICTEVKVEVGEKNNTLVKYRYRLLVLKYSSEVVLLRYYTPLVFTSLHKRM